MADALNTIKSNVLQALREYSTLAALHTNWSEVPASGGHVFEGMLGLTRGRNRGRMPFIEVEVGGDAARDINTDAGESSVQVTIRGWYDNDNDDAGADLLRTMLKNCVKAIRNAYFDTSNDYYESADTGRRTLYQDASFIGPTIERYRNIAYGTVTLTIKYVFDDGTLI